MTLTLRQLLRLCDEHALSLDAPIALSVHSNGFAGSHVLREVTRVLRHDDPTARLVLEYDGPRSGTFHPRLELMRPEGEFTELEDRQILAP